MKATNSFASNVSDNLPDSEMHGNGSIITIIELLIPIIIPLIERCFDNDNLQPQSFGAGCKQLATEAQSNVWKRIAFRWHLRRELGWRDYRELGGSSFAKAFIATAANSDVSMLNDVHNECCDDHFSAV